MRQSRCLLFLISEILQQWKKYCFNKKKKSVEFLVPERPFRETKKNGFLAQTMLVKVKLFSSLMTQVK